MSKICWHPLCKLLFKLSKKEMLDSSTQLWHKNQIRDYILVQGFKYATSLVRFKLLGQLNSFLIYQFSKSPVYVNGFVLNLGIISQLKRLRA
ncbi:hypothetical protein FRX31_026251 [Thalictrum thalictroides]|uniref:Uncharacterized protein n=1 Tax=Thalictrum thalictroides TaxID=46969 RepID=A0A7J6VHB1_THATH|nr:hypothetical protein FRX31_026251 [Thalictrum thalictroides]